MSPQTIQARQRCSAATSALRVLTGTRIGADPNNPCHPRSSFTSGNMPVGADNDENALRLCVEGFFTSGNMPVGTDNHENRTLIPQMHADQH
jgi:hypothetical protein